MDGTYVQGPSHIPMCLNPTGFALHQLPHFTTSPLPHHGQRLEVPLSFTVSTEMPYSSATSRTRCIRWRWLQKLCTIVLLFRPPLTLARMSLRSPTTISEIPSRHSRSIALRTLVFTYCLNLRVRRLNNTRIRSVLFRPFVSATDFSPSIRCEREYSLGGWYHPYDD